MKESRSLRERRKEIDRELAEIEARMSGLVRHYEAGLREKFRPAAILRRHPVAAFTGSAVAGILLSVLLGKKESGGLIVRTLRAVAARWISGQVAQFIAKR